MRIGERILKEPSTGKTVLVALNTPQLAPDNTWECTYLIADEDGAPTVGTAYGEDALQALCLAIEAIRLAIKHSGRKLSWLGHEPGLTGFHRVNYALGLELVEKLENMIDEETDRYALALVAARKAAGAPDA